MALRSDFGLPFKDDLEAAQANHIAGCEREAELERVRLNEMSKINRDRDNMKKAKAYQERLSPEELAKLREEAFDSLDEQQKGFVLRKTPGADILLKIAMTRLCISRV